MIVRNRVGHFNNGQSKVAVIGLMLVLAGCTTTPKPEGSHIGTTRPVAESARFNSSTTLQIGPGAGAMLQKAEEYTRAGRFDLAITTLERALRMEPRNAWIWNRLAAAHLEARNRQQAAHLATKSNALVSEEHPLRVLNNQIIVRARK